jgi:hypothetical protein
VLRTRFGCGRCDTAHRVHAPILHTRRGARHSCWNGSQLVARIALHEAIITRIPNGMGQIYKCTRQRLGTPHQVGMHASVAAYRTTQVSSPRRGRDRERRKDRRLTGSGVGATASDGAGASGGIPRPLGLDGLKWRSREHRDGQERLRHTGTCVLWLPCLRELDD